jgi:hypothetical protein
MFAAIGSGKGFELKPVVAWQPVTCQRGVSWSSAKKGGTVSSGKVESIRMFWRGYDSSPLLHAVNHVLWPYLSPLLLKGFLACTIAVTEGRSRRKEGKNAATPNGGGHLVQFGHGYLQRQCTRQSLLYHRQTFRPRIMSS